MGIALVAVLGLGLVGLGYVYGASQFDIGRTYPLPPSHFHASADPGAVARGGHLAQVYGCADCHTKTLQGAFLDFAGMTSRNLPLLAKVFSDADFDRAVRRGLRPDGTSVAEPMPSDSFQYMPDADLADIVAYVRAQPAAGADVPVPSYDMASRYQFVAGKAHTDQHWFGLQKPALDLGAHYAKGRMLAMTACGECHTTTLTGATEPFSEGVQPPDLSLVAAYERADFVNFLRTGKAAGNRELPLMSEIARARFSHFTEAEIGALYEYLAARGRKLTSSAQ